MKRVLFLIGTALLALAFGLSYWQDTNREWTQYQRRFLRTLTKNERRGMTGGITQLIVSDLHRVDRCTSCHVAIDKPQLALAEEPFTAHPGEYLVWHPPERFGCTVCHGGQGLATEVKAAHGDLKHWEEPLLRGPLVQASCRKCHGNLEEIASHVPTLIQGLVLFKAKGCYGCHKIGEFGQTIAPELTEIGSKPYALMKADFEFVEGTHDRINWMRQKLANPRKLNPGFRKEELPPGEEEVFPTAMPNVGLREEEIEALTVYMLSLTEEKLPAAYVIPSSTPQPKPVYASSVEAGRAVFEQYGCLGCHGQGGMGGRKNFNAQLGEEVPSLVYVKVYYDRESLKEFIRTGRQPVPRADPTRPTPPLYMPAWKDKISEEELDQVADYLFSLYEQVASTQPPAQAVREATP